jgi:hypothetical protein
MIDSVKERKKLKLKKTTNRISTAADVASDSVVSPAAAGS